MYARLAIASDAFDLRDLPMAVANSVHRALSEAVYVHGRLVFGSDSNVHSLVRAIMTGPGVPPDARIRWRETLLFLRERGRITVLNDPTFTPLEQVETLNDLRQCWSDSADVAVVGSTACEIFGIP